MLAQYKEMVSHPGRLENEHPMIAFIDEHNAYDETSGNVESPTCWFARAGRWIVLETISGFLCGRRYPTRSNAKEVFDEYETQYAHWVDN